MMSLAEVLALAAGHMRSKEYAQAEFLYQEILSQLPEEVESLYGLGWAKARTGRVNEAIDLFQRVIAIKPGVALYYHAQGAALATAARFDEAIEAYQMALAIDDSLHEVHNHLGNALLTKGENYKAIKEFRRALDLKPDYAEAVANLSCALINVGDLEQPITYCRQAISLWPDQRILYGLLGWAYREAGRMEEGIEVYRQALSRKADPQIHSDLLFTLHFQPDCDRRKLFEEHARWNEIHARPLARGDRPFTNDRSPERRLRLGYFAHDLGDIPLGRFFLPLAEHHDREQFALFCYCDMPRPDAAGRRLHELPNFKLRVTGGMSHQQVAELAEQDQIDILVDLSMHSSNNRMLTFARKPAPVQVTYLAYCSTTGLDAIDYRLTDPYLDPPEWGNAFSAEKAARLRCYWCYSANPGAPEVGPLPAITNGFVTFGCLNEFSKVSPACLSLWCRLLREIPTARLMLHAKQGSHRQRAIAQMTREQIDPQRLQFIDRQPLAKHLAQYNQFDIGLDPFPWGGGTTTCNALWMGAPVVSLAGETGVSRGGLSILSTIGLPELATQSPDDYIRAALSLARDLPRLADLRASLRSRMQSSPLMDAPGFTTDVEAFYRRMWKRWCDAHQS
jgi:predicted O-linked N-acetylglucosamine transferase (SPINDLY family)